MLLHAVEELLNMYVSMSKCTVPKVVQKDMKDIYLTHGEDNQDIHHFVQHPKNACLGMLKSVCLYFMPFLRFFLVQEEKGASRLFYFSGSTKNVQAS